MKSFKKQVISKILIFLFLTGCGYRWEPEYPAVSRPSVYVPSIAGDEDGNFTSEIIRTLNASGLVAVTRNRGDYRLVVSFKCAEAKTIGFRRDLEKIKGKETKNLIASEGRKSISIEAILYQKDTDKIAYGPYLIEADSDFDYVVGDAIQDLAFTTPTDPLVVVLPFSLGQLESNEAAQEAATKPIASRLAQKIVDAIAAEW